MELVVEAFNLDHANECIKNNVSNIILGNEVFATRISHSFTESEITTLNNNKKNTKIWVKVNVFFFEHEINRLIAYLRWLSRIKVDYVIFQDFAVAQINKELNLNLNLHYNPETLITSFYQFDFYQKNNINSVFLARELMMNEVEEIAKNKNGMKLSIQGHGYGFIMYSRWTLISNFKKYYEMNDTSSSSWVIKEKLRTIPNIITEDRHGTNMLTGYLIYTIDLIHKFVDMKIDYLILDFYQTNLEYANKVTQLYQLAIENKLDLGEAKHKLLDLNSDKYILSHGYFGGPKEILHLVKENDEK